MAQKSKFPEGEQVSVPMRAFLQNLEDRRPSDASAIDLAATLPDVIARLNQLLTDLNR